MKKGLWAGILLLSLAFVFAHDEGNQFSDEGMMRDRMMRGNMLGGRDNEGQRVYDAQEDALNAQENDFELSIDHFIDDPESYMQYCDDPEHMVDVVMTEMKSKGAFDRMGEMCGRMKEEIRHCEEENFCEKMQQAEEHCQIPSVDEMVGHCMESAFAGVDSANGDSENGDYDGEKSYETMDERDVEEEQEKILEDIRERCKENADVERERMEEMCKRHGEQTKEFMEDEYKRCKEEQRRQCSQMKEHLRACEDGKNLEHMKEHMIEEGKKICVMYQKNRNFMDAMRRMHGEKRGMMREEMGKILETEDSAVRVERENDKSLITKVLEFLGFMKKDILQDARELRGAADDLEESIVALKRLEEGADEKTREALEQEIARLEGSKEQLYEKADKYHDRASGFFVVVGNFLRGL